MQREIVKDLDRLIEKERHVHTQPTCANTTERITHTGCVGEKHSARCSKQRERVSAKKEMRVPCQRPRREKAA